MGRGFRFLIICELCVPVHATRISYEGMAWLEDRFASHQNPFNARNPNPLTRSQTCLSGATAVHPASCQALGSNAPALLGSHSHCEHVFCPLPVLQTQLVCQHHGNPTLITRPDDF
jgi:hypothetical protein